MAAEFLFLLVLVLANGILAGSEIAVVALRRTRLAELTSRGNRSAQAVSQLRDSPEQFLATVQIGITVVGSTAGAFGGMTFARDLMPLIETVNVLRPHAEEIALVLVILLVSYLSLVLGELVPKSLALRAAERYALIIGRPLLLLSRVARPLVWLLTVSSNAVLKVFGDSTTFTETRVSREELQRMVEEAASEGTVHPHAGEIASRALDLPQLTAHDVMVPRNSVVAVSEEASLDDVRSLVAKCGHSRLPVYHGTIDQVIGYVVAKDLLARTDLDSTRSVREVLRPSYFVPEGKAAIELLHEMRHRHVPFAVVVEEQGGTSGIVTMEDLVEELVGEIFSEHAPVAPDFIHRESDGVALVDGSVTVRDVNRELALHLPEEGAWSTIAGLFLAFFGRIPKVGDRVEVEELILEVLDSSPRRIRRIRISPQTVGDVSAQEQGAPGESAQEQPSQEQSAQGPQDDE